MENANWQKIVLRIRKGKRKYMPVLIKKIENTINKSAIYFNNCTNDNYNQDIIQCLYNMYPYIFENDIINNYLINRTNNEDTFDYLGNLYETSLSLIRKKDYGAFYTRNNTIIEKIIELLDLLSGKILEPACGSGLFLVQIIKKIINLLQAKKYTSQMILDYICENIYANDSDKKATKIAEINMISVLLPLMIESNKANSNFKMKKLHITNYDFTQKKNYNNKFSLVIGNPPFITMYGKHSRNMTEEKRAYFNTFDFVQNKNGNNKFNLCMFFVENGLKYLIKGGKLSFILDISFFETAFIDLRKYIVQNYFIDSLIVELQEFESVASGQLIINIVNIKAKNKKVKFIDYSTNKIYEVNQDIWDNELTKYAFEKPLSDIEKTIISKVDNFSKLEQIFPNKALRTCCALTGKTNDFLIDSKFMGNEDVFPYIEGSKGLKGKFFLPTPQRYIKYDYNLQIKFSNQFKEELTLKGVKNKKRVTLGDKNAYLSPKLFIRQSAREIIATFCDKPCAANNSIYILTTKKNDLKSIELLKYTCGILNSNLITFYCRVNNIIRMQKGKTPQIKISDLKNVRIAINITYYSKMILLVEHLLDTPTNNFLNQQLNKLVYKIYGIEKSEIAFIEKYLQNSQHNI